MSCDVRSCDELSSIVPCTECYERKTPLVVRSRCVVRSGSVTMWWSKSIFLYYSSTTPVLLRTAKYCCSTTLYYGSTTLYYKVLLQYYSYPPHHWPYSSDLGGDFELKNATFGAPAIPQNFAKCWACNEKSHSTFTKYCACHAKNESHDWSASHMKCHWQCAGHQESASNFTKYSPAISQNLRHVAPEKWHSDITKCCPCHEKWHYNITKCCACHESSHSTFTKSCACHEKCTLLFSTHLFSTHLLSLRLYSHSC